MPEMSNAEFIEYVRDSCTSYEDIERTAKAAAVRCMGMSEPEPARTGIVVELQPGDGTLYIVTLMPPGAPYVGVNPRVTHAKNWIVATSFGKPYEWVGGEVHIDYVAEKWTNGNRWSSVIMADFLNFLSESWERLLVVAR